MLHYCMAAGCVRILHRLFASAAKQTNQQTATDMTGMKDAYLCLSLHNVFLEITCCLRDQTCLFRSYYFCSAFQPVLHVLLRLHDYDCDFCFCFLEEVLSSSSIELLSLGEKEHSRTIHHFCVYVFMLLFK